VRAEEVAGAGGGGGEGGGEEAAGAGAAASAAGAQADHRLIRLHASGGENPTRKRIARCSIEESASSPGEIAEESKVVGRGWEGSVCDLSFGEERRREGRRGRREEVGFYLWS
jgi:hypothetical protein